MSLLALRLRAPTQSIKKSHFSFSPSPKLAPTKEFMLNKQVSLHAPRRTFFTSSTLLNQKGAPGDAPKKKPITVVPEQQKVGTKAAVVPQAAPRTVVRQPESMDDIKVGIAKLLDEEIETVKENALALESQGDIVKQFLSRTKYEISEGKEGDIIMKRVHNGHIVTVTFNKDEPVDDEMENENEQAAAEDEEGKEPEQPTDDAAAGGFPQKQTVSIEITFPDKPLKWILGGFAGKDNRLYIEDMSLATEEQTKKLAEAPKDVTPAPVDAIPFESLADNLQDRIYDFLDEVAVDDQLAHFIKVYTVSAEAKTAVKFLENLKDILKSTN